MENFKATLKKENIPLGMKQTLESSVKGLEFYLKMLNSVENKITKNIKVTNLMLEYQEKLKNID